MMFDDSTRDAFYKAAELLFEDSNIVVFFDNIYYFYQENVYISLEGEVIGHVNCGDCGYDLIRSTSPCPYHGHPCPEIILNPSLFPRYMMFKKVMLL